MEKQTAGVAVSPGAHAPTDQSRAPMRPLEQDRLCRVVDAGAGEEAALLAYTGSVQTAPGGRLASETADRNQFAYLDDGTFLVSGTNPYSPAAMRVRFRLKNAGLEISRTLGVSERVIAAIHEAHAGPAAPPTGSAVADTVRPARSDAVTMDEIHAAADAIASESGRNAVTLRAVRARIGRGSMTTLSPHLRAWSARGEASRQIAEELEPTAQATILRAVRETLASALTRDRQARSGELRETQEWLARTEVELEVASTAADEAEKALRAAETATEDTVRHVADLAAQISGLREELAECRSRCISAEDNRDALAVRLGETTSELAASLASRDDLARDVERDACALAEQVAAAAASESAFDAIAKSLRAEWQAAATLAEERRNLLAAADQEAARLNLANVNAEEIRKGLMARIAEAMLEVRQTRASLEDATAEISKAASRLGELEAMRVELIGNLSASAARADLLSEQRTDAEARCLAAERAASGFEARLDQISSLISRQEQQIEALRVSLSASEVERVAAIARADLFKISVDEAKAAAAAMEARHLASEDIRRALETHLAQALTVTEEKKLREMGFDLPNEADAESKRPPSDDGPVSEFKTRLGSNKPSR